MQKTTLAMTVLVTTAMTFGAPKKKAPAPQLELGAALPSFKLPGVDGKNHTEKDYADAKVLALIFTCNHCPTAQAYESRIIKLEADYRRKGVQVVCISPNDDKAVRLDELGYSDLGDSLADMKIRAKDRGFKFPYLYDGETQKFSRAVGVRATPHVFVFDVDRKLRYKGRIDNSEVGKVTTHDLRNAIDDLLAEREVKTPVTRCFGCSTKWAEKRSGVAASDERWNKRPVTLEDIDAAAVKKLAENKTEDFVLFNVWATWCGPCVAEFPDIVTLTRMFERRNFRMVTITVDTADHKSKALKFLAKQHAAMSNFIYTGEDKDKLADALDPKWEGPIPYTVLIAPGGKVVYRHTGRFDAQELKSTIVEHVGRTYASRKKKK